MKLNNSKAAYGIIGGTISLILIGFGVKEVLSSTKRYDKDGYDPDGYDREGYNKEGYNRDGFNREGYNKAGYNADGYDKDGYDCDGYDQDGFDLEGYNKEGFNRARRDKEGYTRNGFGRDGFNREGFDRGGYGRDGYNCSGLDRAGCTRTDYTSHIEQFRERLDVAVQKMNRKEYTSAINYSRVVMEKTLKLIVQHFHGESGVGYKIIHNLKICEKDKIFDDDFLSRLHGVRGLGNFNGHEFEAPDQLTHSKTYFVIMQVTELLDEAEKILVQ